MCAAPTQKSKQITSMTNVSSEIGNLALISTPRSLSYMLPIEIMRIQMNWVLKRVVAKEAEELTRRSFSLGVYKAILNQTILIRAPTRFILWNPYDPPKSTSGRPPSISYLPTTSTDIILSLWIRLQTDHGCASPRIFPLSVQIKYCI